MMGWLESFKAALPENVDYGDFEKLSGQWSKNPRQAAIEALSVSGLFNAEAYLDLYPDVAQAQIDPLWHFVTYGLEEKRALTLRVRSKAETKSRLPKAGGKLLFNALRADSLSVMIPAWNAEHYLERAVRSVFKQNHPNLEIIIYDDGSNDNTWHVAKALGAEDSRVRIYKGEVNKGESRARNECLKNARGNYCTFLDADDFYDDPDFLNELWNEMRTSDADMAISAYKRSTGNKITQDACITGVYENPLAAQMFIDRVFGTHGSAAKIMRTSIAAAIHVDEFGYSEDVPFVLRYILCSKRLLVSSRSSYVYDQNTTSSWRPQKYKPLHFYSSLRLLVEMLFLCWNNGINVTEFASIWRREHGKRIMDYLASPANIASATEILSWYDWLVCFFEYLIPEIRHYIPAKNANLCQNCNVLDQRYTQYTAKLKGRMERIIASASRQSKPVAIISVAHLCNGGLERVAVQFGKALADNYDIFYILDRPDKVDYTVTGEVLKENMLDLRVLRLLEQAAFIADFQWKEPSNNFPFCGHVLRRYRHKYLPTIHNTTNCEAYFQVIYDKFRKSHCSIEELPAVICVSEAVKRAFIDRYGDFDNICVLYNPVNILACMSAPTKLTKYNYILFASRLNATQHKGIDLLVQACAKSSARKRGIKLVMAGSGTLDKSIEQFIANNNLEDSIEIIGFAKDIYSWMKGALFTISASRWEGFSMTIIESLACGTPVLTTNVGGAAEIVKDGLNGLLIEKENIDQLAMNIDKLILMLPEIKNIDCSESVVHLDLTKYAERIYELFNAEGISSPAAAWSDNKEKYIK